VILLALESSTRRAALALRTADGATAGAATDPEVRHGRALLPAIRDLCASAGVAPRELQAVAVGLGPGSFTGTRVGLTAAKTIACAVGCPLYGLSSLEVIARSGRLPQGRLAVAVDAQRREIFTADFRIDGHDQRPVRLGPDRLEPIDAWLDRPDRPPWVLCPDPDRLLRAAEGRLDPEAVRDVHPEPEALLQTALDVAAAEPPLDPRWLEPVYLRRSAAEETHDRAP